VVLVQKYWEDFDLEVLILNGIRWISSHQCVGQERPGELWAAAGTLAWEGEPEELKGVSDR
jgi:hypothetical protein